jgi:hypothetical protein
MVPSENEVGSGSLVVRSEALHTWCPSVLRAGRIEAAPPSPAARLSSAAGLPGSQREGVDQWPGLQEHFGGNRAQDAWARLNARKWTEHGAVSW